VIDHVTVRVTDRAASERFFETILTPLGVDTTYRTNAVTSWANFIVTQASDEHPVTTGLHVAFVAPSREQVDGFWQAGVDAGHPDDGAPGPRPQYSQDYYGAFLRDPDGNSVEAVHTEAPAREGIIDHLWIRVADLAASTAFYRIIAPAAGLTLRREDAERSAFAVGRGGGTFSLVPGPPTRHLHIAFAGHDEDVRRFYADAVAAGYQGNGEPGERPRYHPGYYAAFVFDPDGTNVEVVDHHRATA
jgi:catechol 2,3-dioxygenase-like lactoylglutathione lyase family enzyme